jgi:hypothetical protein
MDFHEVNAGLKQPPTIPAKALYRMWHSEGTRNDAANEVACSARDSTDAVMARAEFASRTEKVPRNEPPGIALHSWRKSMKPNQTLSCGLALALVIPAHATLIMDLTIRRDPAFFGNPNFNQYSFGVGLQNDDPNIAYASIRSPDNLGFIATDGENFGSFIGAYGTMADQFHLSSSWTMVVTNSVGDRFDYTFQIEILGLNEATDFPAMAITSPAPADPVPVVVGNQPTITWTRPSPQFSAVEGYFAPYNGGLGGPNQVIDPNQSSFTPETPLAPGDYAFYVQYLQDLSGRLSVTTPTSENSEAPEIDLIFGGANYTLTSGTVVFSVVPEPAEYALAGGAALALFALWRRQRR